MPATFPLRFLLLLSAIGVSQSFHQWFRFDSPVRLSQASNGVKLGLRPAFNVSIRFRPQRERSQTTLSVVKNGVKRTDGKLSKKLEKRFRRLGPIDSSTDSIVIRWESAVEEQVKYTFTMRSPDLELETSVQGAGRSGFIPKKRSCVGLEMRCPAGLNSADVKEITILLWMTFSNKEGEVLFNTLLTLRRNCGAGQCQRPPSLPNGDVILSETSKCRPGQLIFRCNVGFRLAGCEEAMCGGGEWSCSEPRCAPDWPYRWILRQQLNLPEQPCLLEDGCRPFDLPLPPSEEVCFNVTVPHTVTSIERILCNSDYVVKASLHRYARKETDVLRQRGQIRIIDWEGLMPNRTLPFDASPPFIRLTDSLRQCKDLEDQLVDGDGSFLVAGVRSRRDRYRMRIIVGRRNTVRPQHGIIVLYHELERYIKHISGRLVGNGIGSRQLLSLKDYLAHLDCSRYVMR